MKTNIIEPINPLELFDKILRTLIHFGVLQPSEREELIDILTFRSNNLSYSGEQKMEIDLTLQVKSKLKEFNTFLLKTLQFQLDKFQINDSSKKTYLQVLGILYMRVAIIIGEDCLANDVLFKTFLNQLNIKAGNFCGPYMISAFVSYCYSLYKKNEIKELCSFLNMQDLAPFLKRILSKIVEFDDARIISDWLNKGVISLDQKFKHIRYEKDKEESLLEIAFSSHASKVAELVLQKKSDVLMTSDGKHILLALAEDFNSPSKLAMIDLFFKYLPDLKDVFALLKLDMDLLPIEWRIHYTPDAIKSFLVHPINFIKEICIAKEEQSKVSAYLAILEAVKLKHELFELLAQHALDSNYVKLITTTPQLDFSTDTVDAFEENGEDEEEDCHWSEFEKIARAQPQNALVIIQNCCGNKVNLNQASPLRVFFEIKIKTTFDNNQIPTISHLTFILIDINSIKNVKKLLKLLALKAVVVSEAGDYAIIRVACDLLNLTKKINYHSSEEPYIHFHHISNWQKKKDPLIRIETFLRANIPAFLAANKVKVSTKLPVALKHASFENITRLTKTFREIVGKLAEHDIAGIISLFNYLCSMDYVIMHATKNAAQIISSKKIFSFNQLSKVLLKDVGETSDLDKQFGNTDYVFFVLHPENKPYPKKLADLYGDTVFVFSFEEILKRKFSVWAKSTDWYYFADERKIELNFGNSTLLINHKKNDKKLSDSTKDIIFSINGDVVHSVQNRKIIEESFTDGNIKLGLALLIIEQFVHLDEIFRNKMLQPFLNDVDDDLNKQQRKEVAHQLSKLLPACEASVANHIPLDEEILIDIYSMSNKSDYGYKPINSIHRALVRGDTFEDLEKLIMSHKKYINTNHAVSNISILNKAIVARRYDIMQLLLEQGADVNQPSCITNDSGYFTPIMVAILMSDSTALNLLLKHKANTNLTIYPGSSNLFNPRDRWHIGINPLSLSNLMPTNNFTKELKVNSSFALPKKTMAVFLVYVQKENQQQVLFCRKGYKYKNELTPYGDWVFPALTLENATDLDKESELNKTLSYLLGTEFQDLKFNQITKFEDLRCGLTQYTIQFYSVNVKNENDIPCDSDHLCDLTWLDVNEINNDIFNCFDDIQLHESNRLFLKYLNNNVNMNVIKKVWQIDLASAYLIHKAIIDNNPSTLKQLLQQGLYANAKITLLHPITKQWIPGCTPLITVAVYAAPEHYEEFVRLLEMHGADPDIQDKNGNDLMHHANQEFKKIYTQIFQEKNKALSKRVSQLLSNNCSHSNNNNRKRSLENEDVEENVEPVTKKR